MERCRGTRAATTPRKLPNASPGTNTSGRTKSITLLSTPARRRLSARRDSVSVAVLEVSRRVDPIPAGWPLDRERSDRDRREGAAELLPQHDRLRSGHERPFRHGTLSRGDRVLGVEAALERRLRWPDGDTGESLRGEDEELLVRVPVAPVAIGALRVDDGAEFLAGDGDVATGVDDGLAVGRLRAVAVAAPPGVLDRLVARRRHRD